MPDVTIDVTANPAQVIAVARIIARHLTALADDLEQLTGRGGPVTDPLTSQPIQVRSNQ
jgi:hypothetical protein